MNACHLCRPPLFTAHSSSWVRPHWLASLNASQCPPIPSKKGYLGSLERTCSTYAKNPVGRLIQEVKEISWGIRGKHIHICTQSCVYTLKQQHTYSHVQEALNPKYLHNDRFIFTHEPKHAEENLEHKTSIHKYENTQPQMVGHTHTHAHTFRAHETWWRCVLSASSAQVLLPSWGSLQTLQVCWLFTTWQEQQRGCQADGRSWLHAQVAWDSRYKRGDCSFCRETGLAHRNIWRHNTLS